MTERPQPGCPASDVEGSAPAGKSRRAPSGVSAAKSAQLPADLPSNRTAKLPADLPPEVHWPDAAAGRDLRRRVLRWFAANRRDLPWRRTQDPYAVWVSEVMLQQTQVVTVQDYWPRFLQSFPTVGDLAAAPIEDVLRLWQGLGYYRRAKQLHAAAQVIVQQHGGQFPTRFSDVLALPGVGRYTAGAVLSIATQQSWPILEGNTIRLYSRLLGLGTDPTTPANQQLLWRFAETIVPKCRPGDFNQGLMELGGQVCQRHQPKCGECPLRTGCNAYQTGRQAEIPAAKSKPTRWETRTECLLLLHRGQRWLGRTLPAGQRWAGLWDFPRFDIGWLVAEATDEPQWPLPPRALEWLQQQVQEQFGLHVQLQPGGTPIRHAVTRFRILLAIAQGQVSGSRLSAAATAAGWEWLSAPAIGARPLNVTARQVWEQQISLRDV